jgi:hypothetical protein
MAASPAINICVVFRCVVFALLAIGAIQGQDTWKKRRDADLGNRYEALIDMFTSSPQLELISFTSYIQPYEGSQEWTVKFFSNVDAPAVVYARDVTDEFQYRMESKPIDAKQQRWSTFGGWTIGAVLGRYRIPSSNIGIVVRFSSGDEQVAPAMAAPTAATPPPKVEFYQLLLRPGQSLDRVDYDLSGIKRGKRIHVTGTLSQARFEKQNFLLRLDVREFDRGAMNVVVSGTAGSKVVCSKQLNFYHNPDVSH